MPLLGREPRGFYITGRSQLLTRQGDEFDTRGQSCPIVRPTARRHAYDPLMKWRQQGARQRQQALERVERRQKHLVFPPRTDQS